MLSLRSEIASRDLAVSAEINNEMKTNPSTAPPARVASSESSSQSQSPRESVTSSPLTRRIDVPKRHSSHRIGQSGTSLAERRARMRLSKLTEDELLDLEFAAYGDVLRRISWLYLNRPKIAVKKDETSKDHALPFAPLMQSTALLQFAKDFNICPLL